MPIIVPPSLRILSDTVYRDLNRQVLGLIFKVQNDYGRVCDESVFKGVIASRWSKTGKVEREVPIVLNHQWYSKTYFFDLLFEDGLMVEAKAVERLVGRHRAQSLSYLLMADLRHGILVNLRSPRVEHKFVSTQLSPEARRKIDVRLGPGERCAPTQLVNAAESLLRDWGGFLEVSIYRDAITALLNLGEPKPVEVLDGDLVVGRQPMLLLDEQTSIAITALHEDSGSMAQQLGRLLQHTRLAAIHWLNFNRTTLEVSTISKP